MNIIFNIIKGGRGEGGLSVGNVKIELFVVSDKDEFQLQDAFYRIQKYRSQPKFSHFQFSKSENTCNSTARAICQKSGVSQLKNFYHDLRIISKLSSSFYEIITYKLVVM